MKTSSIQKTSRNRSVEVLRCILMLLIVLHHCTELRSVELIGHRADFFLSDMTSWHVDCFVAISGWFGISLTVRKFLKVWGLMFFSSALSALYAILFGGGFSWKAIQITGGWFGGSYLMLMLLVPILNAGISALGREGKLLWGMGGFVLGVVAFWMPANLMTGIAPHMVGSVSFFSMMFIYMVARSVRELNDRYDLKRWAYCGVMIYPVGLAVAVLIACMAAKMQGRVINYGVISHYTSSYLAPHNVLMAISVLLIFLTRLRLPRMVEKVGAFLAPSMFSVYLLHHTTSFGRCLYQEPQRYLVEHCAWRPMFAILCTVFMTFCLCLILDFMRRALLWAGRNAMKIVWGGR